MHAECNWCGEMAMNHRLTDTGNFYCLEFNHAHNSYMRSIYPIIRERRQAAMRAPCNKLCKARFPEAKAIAKVIIEQWLTFQSTSAIADTQLEL